MLLSLVIGLVFVFWMKPWALVRSRCSWLLVWNHGLPNIVRRVVCCCSTLNFFNVKWEVHHIFEVILNVGIGFCCLFLLIIYAQYYWVLESWCSWLSFFTVFVLWDWVLLSFYIKHVHICIVELGFVVLLCKTCAQYCWILEPWCSWLSLLLYILYDSFVHFQICALGMYGSYVWFGYGIIKMRACWWVWIDVYVITMKQPTTPDFNSYVLVMEISYVKSLCLVFTSTSKLKLWWVSCHVCLFISLACCHSHQSCATSSTTSQLRTTNWVV